ncbi:uncharacterized protein KQ657_003360 [Scheffersomyces spartinae]|uniref:R3H domain-containing protein n=1 Tax=Scheffersomyces spartinae TaxID=45513 RepID=A0A9P7VDP5_9ASCO|nr:uncharacterized protein KQ657_003360 [Scheffersomyces spartinae]KAG7195593.1 hypothetical protein KQ657_003360 [Scheffersomyces spartinae]
MVEVESIKGEVPSSITKALIKQQERVYLLHLEKSLVNFIKNNILQLQLLNQSPVYVIHSIYLKNSYYRLLTHQLCQYYNLQHWNNQQNEIVVSPRQNFDYGDFITHVDNPSSPKFTKLSVYIQMEMNTQHMIFSNELLSRSHSQKTQPRAPLNTAISSIRPAARQIKLIRKDKPSSPSSVSDTVNGEGEVSFNSATIASAKSDDTSSSSVTDMTMNMEDLAISDSSSTSTESHDSKIESDRATKEALYRKLRDEIFDQEDDIEATQGYRYILKSVPIPLKEKNPHEHGRQYGLDPDVKQNKSKDGKSQHQKNRSQNQNQNQNQTKTKIMSQSQSQTVNEASLNPKPKPIQNQTMVGRTGVSFVPAYPGMSIPLQYNGGAQSGTGVISTPMVAVYPQQQQPSHGAYFGVHFPPPPPPTGYYPGPVLIAPMAVPTTCNGSAVVHGPPQLVPTTTAIPSGIPPNGIYSGMSEYGNRTSYDKETERKILNNPYIIIPDSGNNVTRNKTRKRYNNTNNNNNGGINETKGK